MPVPCETVIQRRGYWKSDICGVGEFSRTVFLTILSISYRIANQPFLQAYQKQPKG